MRRRRLVCRNSSLVTKAAGLREGLGTLSGSVTEPVFIPGGKEAQMKTPGALKARAACDEPGMRSG